MIIGWSVPTWSQAELAMPSKVIVRLEVRFPLLLLYFALPAAGKYNAGLLSQQAGVGFPFPPFST